MLHRFASSARARRNLTLMGAALLMVLSAITGAGAAGQGGSALRRGPENAVVTILEFSDFECPFCGRMPVVLEQLLQAYPDSVRLVFKHFPLPMHPHAPLAHEAALAAAAQGKFWPMHDLLFANQARLAPEDLDRYASQLQLNLDDFRQALGTHAYKSAIGDDAAEAAALGIDATPTFFINGRKLVGAQTLATLRGVVEEALGRPGTVTASTGPAPTVNINVEGAPILGTATAPVTIVAFSDLQCPFCARAVPTLHEILKLYPGKVQLAFKHFPLDMHANAPLAHRAALAAREQGRFWEMHDALFADQSRAARQDFVATAGRLGLDVARFEADLASDRFSSVIERDKQEGERLSIDGTPTFFINGVRLVGAQPLASFRAVIDREIAKTGTSGEVRGRAEQPSGEGFNAFPNRSFGTAEAPVTITWFGDLRSPLTVEASRLVKQTIGAYGSKVRVVYRHFPSASRPESVVAYDAALAAAAQSRFWEMQDLLAANPDANTVDALVALGKRLSLDQAKFEADVRNRTYRSIADDDVADARRRDVRGTPAFFVDDERIDGIVTFEEFKRTLDRHLP